MTFSLAGAIRTLQGISHTIVGGARRSTDKQDLTAQRAHLVELSVAEARIYLDHGLTGTIASGPASIRLSLR